jgi:hypothetical protein
MQMRNAVCLIASSVLLPGCISLTNFTPHSASGKSDQVVSVMYQAKGKLQDRALDAAVKDDTALTTAISSTCGQEIKPSAVDAVLAPIAIALGRLIFDQIAEAELKKLEKLKKASSATYSGTVFFEDDSVLKLKDCLLLVRTDDKSGKIGFAALLAIRKHGTSAFTIEPRFVRASNAVAVTAPDKPEIGVSLAIAIKTVGKSRTTSQPELIAAGQGAVSVSGVSLTEGATPYLCPDPKAPSIGARQCPSSDLIPYPESKDKRAVSVTFSVTETGNVGFDMDARTAEIKALKEAIGPALSEALKEAVKSGDD